MDTQLEIYQKQQGKHVMALNTVYLVYRCENDSTKSIGLLVSSVPPTLCFFLIEAEAKWTPYHGWHFQTHFLNYILFYFDSNFTYFVLVNNSPDYGTAPNSRRELIV